jgi:glutathione S-transferase
LETGVSELLLYVGNKNYSSWSMRPWLALKAAGIPFRDEVIPFDFPGGNPAIKTVSETGKVPLLVHEGFKVWESLAIIEYAAELYPDAGIWPGERKARGRARSVSMEMATGFQALRNACPMNLRHTPQQLEVGSDVLANVARITTIWKECLSDSGGPFLFGAFSAADAMYAPVVSRFMSYMLPVDDVSAAYMSAVAGHAAFQAWAADAAKETWVVPEDEV